MKMKLNLRKKISRRFISPGRFTAGTDTLPSITNTFLLDLRLLFTCWRLGLISTDSHESFTEGFIGESVFTCSEEENKENGGN